MHVIQYSNRIYSLIFLCLCAAFFLAPSVANANEYWSVLERRFIPSNQVPNAVQEMLGHKVSRPSGSTLSTVPSSPTISKNPLGGLSQTSQNIIKTMGQPSTFNSTLNNSVGAAQTALKSCLRSPACATRALGAGAVIYEGITAWKDVYDILADNSGNPLVTKPLPVPPSNPEGATCQLSGVGNFPSCQQGFDHFNQNCQVSNPPWYCPVLLEPTSSGFAILRNDGIAAASLYYIPNACPFGSVNSLEGCQSLTETTTEPVSYSELDQMIDDAYEPAVSDAPIVLLSGEPETISLTTPASAELPATTTTNTDSQGNTTTTVKNSVITYNVLNNNSSSPSIESTITETTNTYDDTANLVGSMTSTTTNNPVAPDPVTPPSSGASADIELPPFCTYASIVCDWIGWTKEGIEGEEPDLINLISEFEPDDNQYNSGIGSGSCPAPMSLNLGIINRVVEVSYQPFCDFLDMIRPLVIAGAWLLSAFMYVGVLRRG